MKAINFLGNIRSGVVLRSIVALCVLVLIGAGCKKDEPMKPSVTLPTIEIFPNSDLEVFIGDTIPFNWKFSGSFENPRVTINEEFISNAKVGEYSKVMLTPGIHTFKASCEALDGTTQSKSFKVTVKDPGTTLPVTANIVSDKQTIVRGKTVTVGWTVYNAQSGTISLISIPETFSRIFVDSVGSLPLTPNVTTTYVIEGSNENGLISDSTTVIVTDPPIPDSVLLLVNKNWMLTKEEFSVLGNVPWENRPISSCEADDTLKFYLSGMYQKFQGIDLCIPSGPQIWDEGTWYFLSNYTQLSFNGICEIKILNSTTFQYVVYCPGCHGYLRITYTHFP